MRTYDLVMKQKNNRDILQFGYLVPEFPGQTHAFFWRELNELRKLGAKPFIISTRLPKKSLMCHRWSEQAISETTYLIHMSIKQIFFAITRLFHAGSHNIKNGLNIILSDTELSFKNKIKMLPLLLVATHLANIANKNNWSHIHVHSAGRSSLIARLANELYGISYSIMLHGPLRDYGTNQKKKWKNASFGIVITDKLLNEIQEQIGKDNLPSLFKAPMGVDIKYFKRKSTYKAWKAGEKIKIFSCGRLNPCKGHDDLIRACLLLKKNGLSLQLHIAGTDDSKGAYCKELVHLISQLDLSLDVTLLGAIPEDSIRDELEQSHFFSLASKAEPLGVAIMEAMSMKVPVIVTNAGGVTELVRDGIDGITVPVHNPQSIADGIKKLMLQPNLSMKVGENAYKRVSESFHSRKSAEILISNI